MAEKAPDLSGRDIEDLGLHHARVRRMGMVNARVTGAYLLNASIEGDFEGLRMNGVLVAPLIEAELKKQHPILGRNDSRSADGLRRGVEDVYALWGELEARAAALDESQLHERVDEEWSFVETMRHLIYASDCWFRRGVLNEAEPFHAIGVTHTEAYGEVPGIDLDADPTFAEVIAARRENQAAVRAFAATLTNESVQETRTPTGPGHPDGAVRVGDAFWVIVNEEFWHGQYAARDLDALTAAR
ncbi:MAG: hypothetical protein QOJ00_264 [Actinomycetota bacterium]|jgi:uncharacterized damage-inducible protein DinB